MEEVSLVWVTGLGRPIMNTLWLPHIALPFQLFIAELPIDVPSLLLEHSHPVFARCHDMVVHGKIHTYTTHVLANPDFEQPPDTTIQTVTHGYCMTLYHKS